MFLAQAHDLMPIQSRIQDFPDGAPTPKGGASTYYFAKFLLENERIWTKKGNNPGTFLDPPLPLIESSWNV